MADQDRESLQNSEQEFNVIFHGNLLDGYSAEAVAGGISRLFKLEPARVDQLFNNPKPFLKRNIKLSAAEKIVAAMATVGAQAEIEPVAAAEPARFGALSLAPVGADVLPLDVRDEKPAHTIVDRVKLATLAVEPPGADVLSADEHPEVQPLDVDLSHLKLES